MRTIIRLLVIGLIVHALYQFLPVYLHYQQFKDDVKQTGLFARDLSEAEIAEQVMAHARQRRVPLSPENIQVRRVSSQLFIDAGYAERVKLIPGYAYVWNVQVSTSTFPLQTSKRAGQ